MANTTPFYRMYLNEKLRKFLGINLKNKKLYIFKIKDKVYLSPDVIPKSGNTKKIKVTLGSRCWFINLPISPEYLDYEPTNFKLLNTRGRVIELSKN